MSGWLQALILGVLQGLTEFLPVSSSGHLVLAQIWLGDQFAFLQDAVAFDLILHVGTLLPVFWFYRADLTAMVKGVFSGGGSGGAAGWLKGDPHRWLAFLVVLATIPTGLMGVGLKDTFESLFHDGRAVCAALFFTACLLYSTRFFGTGDRATRQLGIGTALLIGIAQGIAITPGISRSGTTISVALLLGLDRNAAARFSFLLAIPAILGAVVLKAKDGITLPADAWIALGVGFVSSMVVGYFALWMLVALVRRGRLYNFSYYLWPVSVVGFILFSR